MCTFLSNSKSALHFFLSPTCAKFLTDGPYKEFESIIMKNSSSGLLYYYFKHKI